jgi:hypothetical protein
MNLMRSFRHLMLRPLAALALLMPRTLFAGCAIWAGRKGVPTNPAAQAAMFTTLGFTAVALGGCAVLGIILYRRSNVPRLPHHDLIEELENYEADAPSD